MDMGNWNILICVSGKTPQIVTESYYLLSVIQKIKIDEIIVLTTTDCKEMNIVVLDNKINEINTLFKLPEVKFGVDNIISANSEAGYFDNPKDISDYTTTDLTFDFLSAKSSEQNKLYCCMSGGRKTMSSDLALAFTIFARKDDVLFHVVNNPDLYPTDRFYPQSKQEDNGLVYIEKPVFRLRNKLNFIHSYKNISYKKIIELTQQSIDNCINFEPLTIDTKNKLITIGDISVSLQPLNLAIYLMFAKSKSSIAGGKNFSRKNSETLWKIYRRISASKGQSERVARNSIHNEIFDFDIIQKGISIIKSTIRKALRYDPIADYYTITTSGVYADKRYEIKLPKSKIKII